MHWSKLKRELLIALLQLFNFIDSPYHLSGGGSVRIKEHFHRLRLQLNYLDIRVWTGRWQGLRKVTVGCHVKDELVRWGILVAVAVIIHYQGKLRLLLLISNELIIMILERQLVERWCMSGTTIRVILLLSDILILYHSSHVLIALDWRGSLIIVIS